MQSPAEENGDAGLPVLMMAAIKALQGWSTCETCCARELPTVVIHGVEACLRYRGKSVTSVGHFIQDCTLFCLPVGVLARQMLLKGVRNSGHLHDTVMSCFRKIFRVDNRFLHFYTAGNHLVYYRSLVYFFTFEEGWDTLLTCLQTSSTSFLTPEDAYRIAVPLAEILQENVRLIPTQWFLMGAHRLCQAYKHFFNSKALDDRIWLTFENAAEFQTAAVTVSVCLNKIYGTCPKMMRPWQSRLTNYVKDVLTKANEAAFSETALERFIETLFATNVDDPHRRLSKKEMCAINDCIQSAQKVLLAKLKSHSPLTKAMQCVLGHIFLRHAHPESFLMKNGACSPFSEEALVANQSGDGFKVPLSGASHFFIKNANMFYNEGGFDAVLRRLKEQTLDLPMEEVFLYLEVFSVCRFCCTAIWIEKYVHDVFKAVMRHLECPCFATLDSKLDNHAVFRLVSRTLETFLLKCKQTYLMERGQELDVLRHLYWVEETDILERLQVVG